MLQLLLKPGDDFHPLMLESWRVIGGLGQAACELCAKISIECHIPALLLFEEFEERFSVNGQQACLGRGYQVETARGLIEERSEGEREQILGRTLARMLGLSEAA